MPQSNWIDVPRPLKCLRVGRPSERRHPRMGLEPCAGGESMVECSDSPASFASTTGFLRDVSNLPAEMPSPLKHLAEAIASVVLSHLRQAGGILRPKTLTLKAAAAYTHLSVPMLRRAIASGRLASVRMGSRVLVRVEDVDRFIDARLQGKEAS